jgi:hypothetical protein
VLRLAQVTVNRLHTVSELRAEVFGDLLGKGHRAVPTAGTTHGDGYITFSFSLKTRNAELNEGQRVGEELLRVLLAEDIVENRFVLA